MKLDGKNIIFSEDVTLSGQSSTLGNTLDEVLVKQDKAIERVSRNVKWLYKYGGTGSGLGSGSGTGGGGGQTGPGVSTNWSIAAYISSTINAAVSNLSITDGKELSLKNQGLFTVRIHINSPKGGSYYWLLSAGGSAQSGTMTIDTGYDTNITLNLRSAGTLSLMIRDADGIEKNISTTYTVQDYSFTSSYLNEGGSIYTASNNEFLLQNVTGGLYYTIAYSISLDVEYINYNIHNSYTDLDYTNNTNITAKTGVIRIPIVTDSVSTRYSTGDTIKGTITIVYKDTTSATYDVESQFILVPKDLFLITSTKSGAVYSTILSSPVYYNSGIITLQFKPYFGIKGQTAKTINCNIVITKDDLQVELSQPSIDLTERVESSWSQALDAGSYKIQTTLSYGNNSNTFIYYIYVREVTSNAFYYFDDKNKTPGVYPVVLNQYQRFNDYNKKFFNSSLTQTVLNESITTLLNLNEDLSENDLYIALGIQYYEVNDTNTPIATLKDSNDNQFITIYQNRIEYSDLSVTTYIPLSSSAIYDNQEFHLIQIYRRFLPNCSDIEHNEYRSELVVYIDGVLDGANTSFISGFDYPKDITFESANYWLNLAEIAFVDKTIQMDDSEILMYYYAYAAKILSDDAHADDIEILQNCFIKQLVERKQGENTIIEYVRPVYQDKDFFMKITDRTIENLIGKIEKQPDNSYKKIGGINNIPILIMQYNATENDPQSIKEWLNYSYGQAGIEEAKIKPIAFSYYLNGILLNNLEGYTYNIKPQGSTTSEYFGKNLTLSIDLANSDENKVALFTPNFDSRDTTTFLPEQSFTLKADCSDSSHSNNNAMGKFLNANTTKFVTPYTTSLYNGHVKNCLTGFPCIVVVKDVDLQGLTENYFLGIYNFNLGRSSYYNLGYKDNSIFTNLTNGYGAYTINKDLNGLNENIIVAEILDNSKAFDYSQYDKSVLFRLNSEVDSEKAMFGDIIPNVSFNINGKEVSDGTGEAKDKIQKFVEKVSNAGGYLFLNLHKEFAEFTDSKGSNAGYNTINTVPSYRKQTLRNVEGYYYNPNAPDKDEANVNALTNLLGNDEITAAVDYQSVLEYYTAIMAFGMVDSVLKNQNIKSFNGGLSFYLAFYDMDTSFGKDNEGKVIAPHHFSDTWSSALTGAYLSNCNIYRDYSVVNTGYDMPSSYLFAVVKYLTSVASTGSYATYDFPLNLWAKWRANDGICRNANHVIDTYYANHLSEVPNSLFNINYRYKYLNQGCSNDEDKSTTSYFSKVLQMFSGRNIHRTRDWLNNRFHILDFYFNVGGYTRPIYINTDNADLNINESKIDSDAIKNLQSNSDVIALHSAFTSNRFASFTPLVTSLANSFTSFVVNGSESARYYFALQKPYQLNVVVNGSLQTQFYGSSNWVDIDSFNFVTNAGTSTDPVSMGISSKYLTKVKANSGTVNGFTFTLPSLKEIELTGNNFYGGLSLKNTNELNMPNLNKINISGSRISLEADSIPVRTINASNIGNITNFATSLAIRNCNQLQNGGVNLNNSFIQEVSLSYSWGNTLNLTNTHFRTLNVTATKPNLTFSITGDTELYTLSVVGFKTITISGCTNLNKVSINNGQSNVTSISITDCNATKYGQVNAAASNIIADIQNTSNSFKLNTDENGIVDLSGLTELTTITFKNTRGFYKVVGNLKELILPSNAFASTHLVYLDGQYNCTGRAVFNSKYFTLKKSDGITYADFRITSNNCSSMFNGWTWDSSTGALEYTVSEIQMLIDKLPDTTTSISSIFYARPIKDYTINIPEFINPTTEVPPIYFSNRFTQMTSVTSAFRGSDLNYWNEEMFAEGFGANDLDISDFISTSPVYAPINFLKNIASKIGTMSFGAAEYSFADYRNRGGNITFVNPEGTADITKAVVEIVNLSDIFMKPFPRLKRIHNCNINNNIIDFDNGNWGENTPNLEGIYAMFHTGNKQAVNLEGAFSKLTKLNFFKSSLNLLNEEPVNLMELFDWNSIKNKLTIFQYISSDSSDCRSTIKTYITALDFDILMGYIINSTSLTNCDLLFLNCQYRGTSINLDKYGINKNITSLNYFFNNFNKETPSDYIEFDIDIFKHFLNVTDCRYMFANTHWENQLPINFFNTRTVSSLPVYVHDGTTREETRYRIESRFNEETQLYEDVEVPYTATIYNKINAILKLYSYTGSKISSIQGMFSNVVFKVPYFVCDDAYPYQNIPGKEIVKNSVTDDQGNEYTAYYLSYDEYATVRTLLLNNEFVDMHIGHSEDYTDTGRLYNFVLLEEGAKYPIIPPDFFYSKTAGSNAYTNNKEVFNNANLQGFLPKNLFINCKTTTFENCFYNTNIVPVLIGTSNDNKVYLFVPDGFTSATDLTRAFNFKLRLPVYTEGNTPIYTVLSDKSISNILKMTYAWPMYSLFFINNSSYSTRHNDVTNYYYIMTTVTGEVDSLSLDPGIPLSKIQSSIDYTNAFDELTTMVINGPFIKGWEVTSNTPASAEIIRMYTDNGGSFVSKNLVLPAYNSLKSSFIKVMSINGGGTRITLNASLLSTNNVTNRNNYQQHQVYIGS